MIVMELFLNVVFILYLCCLEFAEYDPWRCESATVHEGTESTIRRNNGTNFNNK